MIHFYPRNPYHYAAAGYFIKKMPQGLTRVQKWLCALIWLAALLIMAAMYMQRFGIPF